MIDTVYHRVLRIALLVTAFVLVFDSGFISPITKQFSDNAMQYLAQSVGASARVEVNELNALTAQLTERERDLADREARLRDIEARTFTGSEENDYSTYILSIILFILTVLILTNYALDWRRARPIPV